MTGQLFEVLPPPGRSERAAVEAVDESLRVAIASLERRSYSFSAAAFRGALGKLAGWLPAGSAARASPAVRARFEAAAAYSCLCALLEECEQLRAAAAASAGPGRAAAPEVLRRLCRTWACVLRVAKAPKHTVLFAVQAMATFFALAQPVGGWAAAHQVASMLLARWRPVLSAEELEQVEYVKQVTTGRDDSTAACGPCPRCRCPLDLLAPACAFCGAEVVVAFRERQLCDADAAVFCTLCTAGAAAPGGVPERRPRAGGVPQSVKATACAVCGVGEMRRLPRSGGGLAY